MAFGSWFKNIVKGVKNVVSKVLPIAKKGTELIKNIAPIAGNIIGGKAGEYINKAGDFAGNLNGAAAAESHSLRADALRSFISNN